ncbi:MAG: hypothetical protein BWY45_03046 [Euryarchaeota archaeon ADurb.Bin294]|jgi:hypothetical protein|nr:MAG: hypothetical protein BWY45_03046 [Euryarchaeota archaeon ADurb.Bin294]
MIFKFIECVIFQKVLLSNKIRNIVLSVITRIDTLVSPQSLSPFHEFYSSFMEILYIFAEIVRNETILKIW